MRNRKFKKNTRTIQKIKKMKLWLLFEEKQIGKGREKEKIKIIVPFRSVPTRHEIENSKKMAKKFKKLKNTNMASFQSNIGWGKAEKERK